MVSGHEIERVKSGSGNGAGVSRRIDIQRVRSVRPIAGPGHRHVFLARWKNGIVMSKTFESSPSLVHKPEVAKSPRIAKILPLVLKGVQAPDESATLPSPVESFAFHSQKDRPDAAAASEMSPRFNSKKSPIADAPAIRYVQ